MDEELEFGFYLAYNACMFFVEDLDVFKDNEKRLEILEQE